MATHDAKPASKNAAYWTHCKNCDKTLIRVPNDGKAGGKLAHPIIEWRPLRGFDVVGWRDHCAE